MDLADQEIDSSVRETKRKIYIRHEFDKYVDTDICAVAEIFTAYGLPTAESIKDSGNRLIDFAPDILTGVGWGGWPPGV